MGTDFYLFKHKILDKDAFLASLKILLALIILDKDLK